MHIPDGYLSPQTTAAFAIAMVPIWWQASRKVRDSVTSREIPLVALAAAFSFVVMMFNFPVPGGTTAHAAGGGLTAVLLGPWAACIAISTTLLIQALFFGDGGILALPANAFNLAFVLPFVSYGIFRLIAGSSAATSRRRILAAAAAGYIGINAAAFTTAVEFGIQPKLFHSEDGTPLYAPFPMAHAIAVMMLAHLLVAGLVEGGLAGGVVGYLQKTNIGLLSRPSKSKLSAPARPATSPIRAGLIALGVLAALSPLGLLAPGTGFGEDAPRALDLEKYHLTAVPAGLRAYSDFWGNTLIPGYGGNSPWWYLGSTIVGALVGGLVTAGITWLVRQHRRGSDPGLASSDDVAAPAG